VIPNPKSNTVFRKGDMVGFIGSMPEITAAIHLFEPENSWIGM
jgi:K+/H+ antiporter YhaU regulatory subunit KhtT